LSAKCAMALCRGFVVKSGLALRGLETDQCPFSNLPEKRRTQWALTREEMKNCISLKPEMVGQFEFTEWTPDGHLRHSKFCGFREDKDPAAVIKE
jgi:ATP-dependent DNA ligase